MSYTKEQRAAYAREWRKRGDNRQKDIERGRNYRKNHPDRARKTNNNWRRNNPDAVRAIRKRGQLKFKYGLTPAKWDELFESQGKACAICRSPEPRTAKGWHTDHCHAQNKVRAILCHHCNAMLGGARDRRELLAAAIEYLAMHATPVFTVTPPPY